MEKKVSYIPEKMKFVVKYHRKSSEAQESAKLSFPSSNLGGTSKAPRTISSWGLLLTYYLFTLTSKVLGALGSNK